MPEKINLLNLCPQSMKDFFVERGHKSFRATQVLKWIHQQHVSDFEQMTNLNKSLRAELSAQCTLNSPDVIAQHLSKDGTIKWILKLDDNNSVETVFIPEEDRGTLCVSSQVGCTLNCSFCATGKQGFNRNLTTAEIIGQLWQAERQLLNLNVPQKITNIVMMGMGEPLYNFDAVIGAIRLMLDDNAYMLSKKRVTISTAGVLPEMLKLKETLDIALAVSLHAPNDTLRNELVPLNKKYPISDLMEVCQHYFAKGSKRKILFEYVMLNGINDTPQHASQLAKLIKNIPCKVNLIPYNPVVGIAYRRSSADRIDRFQSILHNQGIRTLTRRTRGDDITAACGQLVGDVKDKTKRSARFKQKLASNLLTS